jgi:hypothetical protein
METNQFSIICSDFVGVVMHPKEFFEQKIKNVSF